MFAVCSIAQVSASDNNDYLNDSYEITTDEIDEPDVLSNMEKSDEISSSNQYIFTDLNSLIQKNLDVKLKYDYSYDDEYDFQFSKNGIYITHELNIDGGGHTIYANGKPNFYVLNTSNEVKISNLNFINIYSPDYLKNAGSISDHYCAGSIYNDGNLYLENCTFTNYYVTGEGGVIYNSNDPSASLYINNCTFINNSVFENGWGGGAIMSYNDLIIENCKFYNCSAKYGGAIQTHKKTYIYNCYFENNTAISDGGAIYKYIESVCYIFNSTFKSNRAQRAGVAYNVISKDCIFIDNHATTLKGHNLYEGLVMDYDSKDFTNENFYNTINSTGFSFMVSRLIYENGGLNENMDIKLTSNPSNQTLIGVYLKVVAVDEDGDNKTFFLNTDENGIATLNLSSFKNGVYNITISIENKKLDTSEAMYTVIIGKSDSKIRFGAGISFEYGGSGSIFIIVEGGIVERKNIKVLGHSEAKITYNNNKEIIISGLAVGKYTLEVITTPDNDHISTSGTVGITVKKATAVITASKVTVVYKKGSYWTIKLINSKTKKPISNMKVNLKIYTGKKYKNVEIKTNSKGEATYKTSKLSKGNHKIVVSATHSGYNFNTVTSSIKVIKPKALTYKVSKKILQDGSSINFRVFDKKTKKPLNSVKVKLLIYTGKKVKTIVLKTKTYSKKKGFAGYFTNEISVGKHKVKIMPVGIKYSGTKSTTIKLKKSAKGFPAESSKITG